MSDQTFTHAHPTLGPLTGRLAESDAIVHFRSIPYATVPARFRPSVLLDAIPDTFDHRPHRVFTDYGFACPGRPHEPSNLPGEQPTRYDEFKCLTVTISAVRRTLETLSSGDIAALNHLDSAPVLVYIHGGAFTEGAGHVSAMHETTRIAALAAREDSDVVVVSIGYRLGAFAGLVSTDILHEARANGDGDIFNQGLFDQRKALTWISRHISGFGGDADRVTVFGESAGSMSIAMHILADEALFSRCAMQSGNTATFGDILSFDEAQATYTRLLDAAGIPSTVGTPESRLTALRAVDQDLLWQHYITAGAAIMPPYYGPEGTFFKKLAGKLPTYTNHTTLTAQRTWLDAVIVGDDFFEGYILFALLQEVSHAHFVKLFKAVYTVDAAVILIAYDITPDENEYMDPVAFYMRAMYLVGDIYFQEPTDQMAHDLAAAYTTTTDSTTRRRKVFRYQFNLPNLFPGTPFSFVTGHHFVEMFYQFLTFKERFPPHRDNFYTRQATDMARRWIAFANGRDPWDEYRPDDGYKIAICDDVNGWHVRTREEDIERSRGEPWGERRYRGWELIRTAMTRVDAESGEEGVHAVRRRLWDRRALVEDPDFVFTFK
ncbi:Cholinesterase [Drechslerella dactyloides]|uniref:Carboxylic ester hydrolase n=1 Tax=Drechslerella dactyloides TaxID=74499 RepID=A0AAD6NHN7_DREDA|nr:Cholinesterase [Drechslerella dactyloides]